MSPSILAMAGMAEAAVFYSLYAFYAILAIACGLSLWAWISAKTMPALISLCLVAICIYLIQPFRAFQKVPISDDPDELLWFRRWRQLAVVVVIVAVVSAVALIAAWIRKTKQHHEKKA